MHKVNVQVSLCTFSDIFLFFWGEQVLKFQCKSEFMLQNVLLILTV